MSIQLFPRSFKLDPTYQEYINCGTHAAYDVYNTSITFSFWLKMDDINALRVPVSRGWYSTGGFYIQINPAQEWDLINNTATIVRTSGGALNGTLGVWTHWLFKKTGGGVWQIYKNGVECSYATQLSGDHSSVAADLIWGDNHTYTLYSRMCDIRWWNRALLNAEIASVVAGESVFYGLIGWWKCQEVSGATAKDSSISGFDGTIVNYGSDANFFSADGPTVSLDETNLLLWDTFTDTVDTALASHSPDANNTGDTWHDIDSVWKIGTSALVKTGNADNTNCHITLGNGEVTARFGLYVSGASYDASFVFRWQDNTHFVRVQFHQGADYVGIYNPAGTQLDMVAWTTSVGYHDVKVVISVSNVKVYVDTVLYNNYNTTLNVGGSGIGFALWTGCSPRYNDLIIYGSVGTLGVNDSGSDIENLDLLAEASIEDLSSGVEYETVFYPLPTLEDAAKPWKTLISGLLGLVDLAEDLTGGGSHNIWSTNYSDNSVKIVDPLTNTVIHSFVPEAGCAPEGLSFGFGYFWVSGNNTGKLYKIDPVTYAVVDSVFLGAGSNVGGNVCSDAYVYVNCIGHGCVYKVDPDAMTLESTINLTFGPDWSIVFDDVQGYIYCPDLNGTQVAKIDKDTDAVTYITVGNRPYSVVVGDTYIYAANLQDSTISKIDRITGAVAGTLAPGESPYGMAFADGILAISMWNENTVRTFDSATDDLIQIIPSPTSPGSLIFSQGDIFVAHGNSMTRISGEDREALGLLAEIPVLDTGDGSYTPLRVFTDTFAGSLGWLRNHTPDFNITGGAWTDGTGGLYGMVVNGGKIYNGSQELPPYQWNPAQCYINHGYIRYSLSFNHAVGDNNPNYVTSGIFLRSTGSNGPIFFYYEQGHFGLDVGAGVIWSYTCPKNTTYLIRIDDDGANIFIWINGVFQVTVATAAGYGNTIALFYAPWYNTSMWFSNFSIDGETPNEAVSVNAEAYVNDAGIGGSEILSLMDLRLLLDSGISESELVSYTLLLGVSDIGVSVGPYTYTENFDYQFYSNYLFHTGDDPSDTVWVYEGITPGSTWPLSFTVPGNINPLYGMTQTMYQDIAIPEGSAFGFGVRIPTAVGVGGTSVVSVALTVRDENLNVIFNSGIIEVTAGDTVYIPLVNNGDHVGPFRCMVAFSTQYYYDCAITVDHLFVSPFNFEKATIFTTNDTSSTNLVMWLNGIKIMDTYLSEPDTEFWNYLPILLVAALNSGPTNVPPAHDPSLVHLDPNYVQLPSHQAAFVTHGQSVIAEMEPADGISNPSHPSWPQYPNIVVETTDSTKPFVFSMEPQYNVNTSFMPDPVFIFTPTESTLVFDMEYVNWVKKSVIPSAALFSAVGGQGILYAPDGWACWRYEGVNALTLLDYTIEFDPLYTAAGMFAVGFRWTGAGGYKLYQQVDSGLWLTKHTSADLLDVGTLVVSGAVLDEATHCRIVLAGSHIQVYLTVAAVEILAIDTYDTTNLIGGFGLLSNGDGWIIDNLVVSGISENSELVTIDNSVYPADLGTGSETLSAMAELSVQEFNSLVLEGVLLTSDIVVIDGIFTFSENFEEYFLYSNYLLYTDITPSNPVWTYFGLTYTDWDWPILLIHSSSTPPGYMEQTVSADLSYPLTFQFDTGSIIYGVDGLIITMMIFSGSEAVTKVISTSPGPGEELLELIHTYSVTLNSVQSGIHSVTCRLYLNSYISGSYCALELDNFQLCNAATVQEFIPTESTPESTDLDLFDTGLWTDLGGASYQNWFKAFNRDVLTNWGKLHSEGSRTPGWTGARRAETDFFAWSNYLISWDWKIDFVDPSFGEASFGFRWTDNGGYRVTVDHELNLKLFSDFDYSLYGDPQELASIAFGAATSVHMQVEVQTVPVDENLYTLLTLFQDFIPGSTYEWGTLQDHYPDINLDAEGSVWSVATGTVELLADWAGIWGGPGAYFESVGAAATIEIGYVRPRIYRARLWVQNIVTQAEAGILIRCGSDMSEYFYVGFHGGSFSIADSDPLPPDPDPPYNHPGYRHYLSGCVASILISNLPTAAQPTPFPDASSPQVWYSDLEVIDDGEGMTVKLNGVLIFNIQSVPYYQANTAFGVMGGDFGGVIGAVTNLRIYAATTNLIRVWVDNVLKITATDPYYLQGTFGFITYGTNMDAWMDNILVTSIMSHEDILITNRLSINDTDGAVSEVILHDLSFLVTDLGHGVDVIIPHMSILISDISVEQNEDIQVIVEALVQEHGISGDTLLPVETLLSVYDSMQGADIFSVLNMIHLYDSGSEFLESLSIITRALISDRGTAVSEILQILAWAWVYDEAYSREIIDVLAKLLMDEGIGSQEILRVFNRFMLEDHGAAQDRLSEMFKMLDILYIESSFGIELDLDNQLF